MTYSIAIILNAKAVSPVWISILVSFPNALQSLMDLHAGSPPRGGSSVSPQADQSFLTGILGAVCERVCMCVRVRCHLAIRPLYLSWRLHVWILIRFTISPYGLSVKKSLLKLSLSMACQDKPEHFRVTHTPVEIENDSVTLIFREDRWLECRLWIWICKQRVSILRYLELIDVVERDHLFEPSATRNVCVLNHTWP